MLALRLLVAPCCRPPAGRSRIFCFAGCCSLGGEQTLSDRCRGLSPSVSHPGSIGPRTSHPHAVATTTQRMTTTTMLTLHDNLYYDIPWCQPVSLACATTTTSGTTSPTSAATVTATRASTAALSSHATTSVVASRPLPLLLHLLATLSHHRCHSHSASCLLCCCHR